jgi:hypothetical protein
MTTIDTGNTEVAENGGEKKRRRRNGENKNQGSRKPKLKDWIRVQNSTGNGLPNQKIHIRINEATNLVELFTVANKAEGSSELEETRCQVFRVTGFEIINDPSHSPIGAEENS